MLERRVTEIAEELMDGVQRGVENGYIPSFVMKHLDDAVTNGLRVANSDLLSFFGYGRFLCK